MPLRVTPQRPGRGSWATYTPLPISHRLRALLGWVGHGHCSPVLLASPWDPQAEMEGQHGAGLRGYGEGASTTVAVSWRDSEGETGA